MRLLIQTVQFVRGCGIINRNAGTIEIIEGTISGYHGINNTSTGEIKIIKGTVSGDCGIYNDNKASIITLGKKEDGEISTENPSITGEGYGIYNPQGTLNFYDGIIKGNTSIFGSVGDIPDNYNVLLNTEDGKEVATIGTNGEIAYIGEDTTNLYDTLKSAIEACRTEENTITIVKDNIIISKDIAEIGGNQNITINLKGKEIRSCTEEYIITNNGTLKITDSSDEQTGKIVGFGKGIIENAENANLTIEKVKIKSSLTDKSNSSNHIISNLGMLNIANATISAMGTNSNAISNTGKLIVNGGIISANKLRNS